MKKSILHSMAFSLILIVLNACTNNAQNQKAAMGTSFEERLTNVLYIVEKKYKSSNQSFGINLSNDRIVMFQIIDRALIDKPENDDFGYAIHLSFDQTYPGVDVELERFSNSELIEKFSYHLWDGIPTYQLDLKSDKEQLVKVTKAVIEIVFEEELDTIEIEEFPI